MEITYEGALKRASFCLREAGIANPRFEAELLLATVLNTDRLRLVTAQPALLEEADCRRFEEALKRRANHEPLAYISGEKYFFGRRFLVNRKVLIPRPETELLIEEALRWLEKSAFGNEKSLRILDLGTGSGNLAITMALELPSAEVWAVDLSPAALQVARQNVSLYRLEERVKIIEGFYFDPLEDHFQTPSFDLIISNPPYISQAELDELPSSVAAFEPWAALDGGADGLDSYRVILKKLPAHANHPALVMVEIGSTQEQAVIRLFKKRGIFRMIGCRRDLANHPRLIFGLL